ncbi:hypothetical protein MBRA1_002051 [Malassezia brasiliensis]|uniref:Uncharacterized protein n=1 Tax=Malassezia brasiliensis TaxID=1821822 RepID=A0AAF0ISX9_9BASI|nr:hypothetical protein MBRA1_002051 [Malassezia brasiliensis]
MANRIAALKALYESGVQDTSDASVEQSMATFHNDPSLSLESEESLDLPASEPSHPAALLSSTEESGTVQSDARDDTSEESALQDPSPTSDTRSPIASASDAATTPRKPTSSNQATPRTATRRTAMATPRNTTTDLDLDESSLSASLRASQLMRNDDAVEELLEDEDNDPNGDQSSSGHWGVQEMRRRTAAGISIKSTQQKIDQLTAERDDLKIEVDFHRRNMSPDDVGAEVISLRQEKLGYVRRLQKLNELVKGQDQALKTVNKQVKAWESKIQDYEALQERLQHAEERARTAEARADAARAERRDNTELDELRAALRTQQLENEALERELASRSDAHAREQRDDDERDALIENLRADLQDAEQEIAYLRDHPESADAVALDQLQRQVDEQHETIASLQDALAAERLIVAEKDGELDRMDQVQQDSHTALAELEEQLAVRGESEAAALAQAQQLDTENQRLERELSEAHAYHDGLASALKEKLSQTAVQLHDAQQSVAALSSDIHELRTERDSLLDQLDRHGAQRAELEAVNARLNEKLAELVKDLKDEEAAREQADTTWSRRYTSSEAQTQRALEAKNELIESLEQQLVQMRTDKQQLEREQQKLQRALQSQDTKQLRRSEDQASERQTLEAERARFEREAKRLAAELARVQEALTLREERVGDTEDHVHRLQAETRELATTLQAEVRARLGAQERYEVAQKALDEARDTLSTLRARRSEVERSPGTLRRTDAPSHAQIAERNQLLTTVYESLTKALSGAAGPAGVVVCIPTDLQRKHAGDDDGRVASDAKLVQHQLPQFSERLMQLVRRLSHIQQTFEQRARALERSQADQVAALRRQQEVRMGQLERIEHTIKAAAAKQAQWRKRIVDAEAELGTLQRTNHTLQQQLSRARTSPAPAHTAGAPSTGVDSPTRWSVRLRELEQRVKEADERVKRERLGAREARARDEAKIRYVRLLGALTPSHLQALVARLETPPPA